jgi:hypothetical protein
LISASGSPVRAIGIQWNAAISNENYQSITINECFWTLVPY